MCTRRTLTILLGLLAFMTLASIPLRSPAASALEDYAVYLPQICIDYPRAKLLISAAFQTLDSNLYAILPTGSGLAQLTSENDVDPSGSPDGAHIAFARQTDYVYDIWVMDADGSGQVQLTHDLYAATKPDWSPDGLKIAYQTYTGNIGEMITVMDADGQNPVQLTLGKSPAWSPDGSRILFADLGDLYIINSDGTGRALLLDDDNRNIDPDWSPDGSKIAFTSLREDDTEIILMNADGTGMVPLTANDSDNWFHEFSPDGVKIAFISLRDGSYEVYMMNADGSNPVRVTDLDWQPCCVSWLPQVVENQ